MIVIPGFVVCDVCHERKPVDFDAVEFKMDHSLMLVQYPQEKPDGWETISERGFWSDEYETKWLCPKHWKKGKGKYDGIERKY